MLDNKQKYLDYYWKTYGDFHTRHSNLGRHRWLLYKSKEYNDMYCTNNQTPNHRVIFPDEIVIDQDKEDEKATKKIDKILNKFKHTKWSSGTKGHYHWHLFFPELRNHTAEDRSKLKELIVLHLLGSELIKQAKVDMPLITAGRHMIRIEYGLHEKTQEEKTHIFGNIGTNSIPKEPYKQFVEFKERQRIWKPVIKVPDGDNKKIPNCMKFFQTEDFKALCDGRERALFYLKNFYYTKKDLKDFLQHWNHYTLGRYFSNQKIAGMVRQQHYCTNCKHWKSLLTELGKLDVCKGCAKNG